MVSFLLIRSGVTGAGSISNMLADEALAGLARDGDTVTVRDLDMGAVPHLSSLTVAALLRTVPEEEEALAARTLSDRLIAELRDADLLIMSAPMYNYGIASTLKAWFDHVIRAGETFEYTDAGPRGFLGSKRALICSARGATYDGELAVLDCATPHLRALLGVMGIVDVDLIEAAGMRMGPDGRETGLAAARHSLATALAALQPSLGCTP